MSEQSKRFEQAPEGQELENIERRSKAFSKEITDAAREIDPEIFEQENEPPLEARAFLNRDDGWTNLGLGRMEDFWSEEGQAIVNHKKKLLLDLKPSYSKEGRHFSEGEEGLAARNAGRYAELLAKVLLEKKGYRDLQEEYRKFLEEERAKKRDIWWDAIEQRFGGK